MRILIKTFIHAEQSKILYKFIQVDVIALLYTASMVHAEKCEKMKIQDFQKNFGKTLPYFLNVCWFCACCYFFNGNFIFFDRTSKPEIDKHNEQFTTPWLFVICLSCWEYFAADTAKLQLSLHVSLVHKTAVFSFRNYRR